MMVYPLTKAEQRIVTWSGRFMAAGALLMIALLGAVSLVA